MISLIKTKRDAYSGFTLIEMLIVLLIVSVLILLFVPNIAKHKEGVDKKAHEAISQIIETQSELYQLENNQVPSVEQLLKEKYITKEQYDIYQANKK